MISPNVTTVNNGKQRIVTPDGYFIPLAIRYGLAHMDMRPPSDAEYESLPHIIFTSDTEWDPCAMDNEVDPDDIINPIIEVHESQVTIKEPNYQSLQPHFAWLPVDKIKATLLATNQWYKAEQWLPMRKHYKSWYKGPTHC